MRMELVSAARVLRERREEGSRRRRCDGSSGNVVKGPHGSGSSGPRRLTEHTIRPPTGRGKSYAAMVATPYAPRLPGET